MSSSFAIFGGSGGTSAERRVERRDVGNRDADRRLADRLLEEHDRHRPCVSLSKLNEQLLDIGLRIHVGGQRRLRLADADLRTPIGVRGAGRRARLEIEDVAASPASCFTRRSRCPLLRDLLDRERRDVEDAGDHHAGSRRTPRIWRGSAARAPTAASPERAGRELDDVHQRRQVLALDDELADAALARLRLDIGGHAVDERTRPCR